MTLQNLTPPHIRKDFGIQYSSSTGRPVTPFALDFTRHEFLCVKCGEKSSSTSKLASFCQKQECQRERLKKNRAGKNKPRPKGLVNRGSGQGVSAGECRW